MRTIEARLTYHIKKSYNVPSGIITRILTLEVNSGFTDGMVKDWLISQYPDTQKIEIGEPKCPWPFSKP